MTSETCSTAPPSTRTRRRKQSPGLLKFAPDGANRAVQVSPKSKKDKPNTTTRMGSMNQKARLARSLRARHARGLDDRPPDARHFGVAETALFKSRLQTAKRTEQKLCPFCWSEWRDLNSRPLDPQSSALPTAPHPDMTWRFSQTA